jgi:hypothetical protein
MPLQLQRQLLTFRGLELLGLPCGYRRLLRSPGFGVLHDLLKRIGAVLP